MAGIKKLLNELSNLKNINPNAPKVGQGITWAVGSDRYAGTIKSVSKTGKTFVYTKDECKIVSGSEYTGDAIYKCEERPDGYPYEAYLSRDGTWKARKSKYRISIGHKSPYTDPSF